MVTELQLYKLIYQKQYLVVDRNSAGLCACGAILRCLNIQIAITRLLPNVFKSILKLNSLKFPELL